MSAPEEAIPASQQVTVPGAPDVPTRLAPVSSGVLSEQITPLTGPRQALEDWPTLADFEIRAELARGGIGVIFSAYEPALKRNVAVKTLQRRFQGDRTVTQRFLEEAQITGQLQHPGIPPIYRVGWLEDGRPYLAMKLIKGETLAERLQRGADVNILATFEAVAQAVGYAHAHGVIHRDLKPQNIMIGPYGEVQVMDWGLAKMVEAQAAAVQTVMHDPREVAGATDTLQGSVLGTPAYMAPEQAAGGHVDQRTDVFGLGAVLCTMLTGRPPFDGALPRVILLQAAQGRLESAYARLDACGADPEVIRLCRRCLAVEPGERPADGNAVAREVAALRAAIEARAKQAEIERARFAVSSAEQRKRRRLSLALVGLLLAGLVATSGLAWWAARERDEKEWQRAEAENQRARAEQKEVQARQSEAESQAVLDFVVEKVFAAARPREEPGGLGPDARLLDAIQASLPYVQQSFPQQPLTAARLRRTIGLTYLILGRFGQALEQLEVARDLYQRHRGPDHADTLATMNLLANSYAALGRHDDALTLREQTLARRRQVLGPHHRDTLTSMNNLALSYAALGRWAEAVRLHEETLALRQQHLGVDHPDTLSSMNNLAQALPAVGRQAEATQLQKKTLDLQRATLGPEHTDTLGSMNNLARSYLAEGRYEDARVLHAEVLRLRETTLGPEHPETLTSVNNLAVAHFALGQHTEALRLFRRAATARQRRAEQAPDDLNNRLHLGGVLGNIGQTLLQQNRIAEAVEYLEQAEDHLLYVLKRQPKAEEARLFLCNVHIFYAMAAERLRRFDEADAHWQKAIELTPDHQLPETKKKRDFWRKKRPAANPDDPDPALQR